MSAEDGIVSEVSKTVINPVYEMKICTYCWAKRKSVSRQPCNQNQSIFRGDTSQQYCLYRLTFHLRNNRIATSHIVSMMMKNMHPADD